jgi:hypothetical protein
MKFVLAIFALVAASVQAKSSQMHELKDIKADSKLGMKLLSQATQTDVDGRKLENNNDDEYSNTWIAGFSLKFQGCHHISQWNDEADGEDDVRIATKRLVRFRMCPSDTCTSSSTGCTSGYGDYIIDMNTYLAYYWEARTTYKEYECEYLENYVCNACEGYDDDNYSEDMCMWDCYAEHGVADQCMDENPYNQGYDGDGDNEKFEVDDYLACGQTDYADYDGNSYYIGPYCASQGGAIYMGMFSDESCSAFADSDGGRDTFTSLSGQEIPYGATNIVDMDCLSCTEPKENNNDGNDADDEDEVAEVCEAVYQYAGKCENNLDYSTNPYPNNNGCNYMAGIKIVRKDGTVITADSKANKTASIFIGVFVVAFVLLSAYVYYLKTKLDRASINLSE